MYRVNVNEDLTEETVIQINVGIMINVDVSVKNTMYLKKIMFGILLHVIVQMSNKVKEIDIKVQTYYFFDDIINIKDFDPNNIKIDEKLYKNILMCYSGYMKIKDSKYVKINSVNHL